VGLVAPLITDASADKLEKQLQNLKKCFSALKVKKVDKNIDEYNLYTPDIEDCKFVYICSLILHFGFKYLQIKEMSPNRSQRDLKFEIL